MEDKKKVLSDKYIELTKNFMTKESMLENVHPEIIDRKSNLDFLDLVPHAILEGGDKAIVYLVEIRLDEIVTMQYHITYALVIEWDLDMDEIEKKAIENMGKE